MSAALVDEALPGPAVVFGSLPPAGRDLDLIVPAGQEEHAASALADAGFVRRGRELVRFACGTAYAVELGSLGLPPEEIEAVFAGARPIEGYERLLRPAPEHVLLVLAKLGFAEKRRPRLEAALAEDPAAWGKARLRAAVWGAVDELEALEARRAPQAGLAGRAVQAAGAARRGGVVALSGLDGAGKSSQAQALQRALEALGHEVVVHWIPLGSNELLDRLAVPVKRLLGRVRGLQPAQDETRTVAGDPVNPGTLLRERSRLVTQTWATVVALANAISHRRLAQQHLLRGRIVIFDRYVLDSEVRLETLYGPLRLQHTLVRLLSPKPLAAFLLDVPPEVVLARKPDRWSLEELQEQARLYRERHTALGVERLDGERPRKELSAHIAETVWRRLSA